MLAAWWFAVLGPPVFALPLPQAADRPSVLAVAGADDRLRRPCRSLRCLRDGWDLPPALAVTATAAPSPFSRPQALPGPLSHGLHAPASGRDWIASEGHDWRVGTRYGFEPIRQPQTQLKVEVGGGYRLQPFVDDGTAASGPVARGHVELVQQLGQRASLRQQLRVESGRNDTYVRNSVALDIQLQPRWLLRSRLEARHDSATSDTAATGSLELHYTF